MLRESDKFLLTLQKATDALLILIAWICAYFIRFRFLPNAQQGLFKEFLIIGLILSIVTYLIFEKNHLYDENILTSRINKILKIISTNFISFVSLIIVLYFIKFERISRLHLGIYLFLSTALLIFSRILFFQIISKLRRSGHLLQNVILVGNGKNLEHYIQMVNFHKDSGINIVGWIDSVGKESDDGIKRIDEDFHEFLKKNQTTNVVVSYPNEQASKLDLFLKKNYNDILSIQILPDLSYSLVGHRVHDFAGLPILSFNQPSFSNLELIFKRSFDFFATLIGMIVISPLLFLIALGVKLSSPGPIFYGQERIGLNGKRFKMWKFRSMRMAIEGEDQTTWSSKDDPRKTKFGSFIRSTSLDELPQLWNVIVGEMSLVGPRPERPFFVEKFKNEIPNYMLRHKMKAGITGWAQVNGWRGDTSLVKRIECDIYYIRHWSFFFDIKIILLTFLKGFINKNAY
ncbi:undecaprenyl-phosphate glucose phosphotransferase [Halobacteriovorax sp. GB3]|uniref:undecaprenyl-phosphate glucose phosphotransferase n=1 Tax=Halobacteriovorax sp. GB3 TaxID=2719615 RepID=UPI0023608CEF|nr:undecaprenyl-phosphate glucose phosphotransferase [Halobacteriovorax sp. GB3]MDD0852545.1 undecaprenyl-phosphate glucose phosphotransferase [Halobacteriovorax sp. GB3]